ncbi:DUF3363 domain-containing protein [Mesorhizobium sp. M0643]|uniref:DUF3363 domain-containing protein n=1 Tax=Mesorhizobium sp. M0643 TaxID=2956978 RepID=UPI00333C2286
MLARQVARLRPRFVLTQNRDDLLFRKPPYLHQSVLQSRPDSNLSGRSQALKGRTDYLSEQGLARREGQRVILARNLIDTFRSREIDALGTKLTAETGLQFINTGDRDPIAGIYRRRFSLASGRFAMIDDGLGFSLVPWSPSLERYLGRHVSGVAQAPAVLSGNAGRKRSLGI